MQGLWAGAAFGGIMALYLTVSQSMAVTGWGSHSHRSAGVVQRGSVTLAGDRAAVFAKV
jgi:hypothetical protein